MEIKIDTKRKTIHAPGYQIHTPAPEGFVGWFRRIMDRDKDSEKKQLRLLRKKTEPDVITGHIRIDGIANGMIPGSDVSPTKEILAVVEQAMEIGYRAGRRHKKAWIAITLSGEPIGVANLPRSNKKG